MSGAGRCGCGRDAWPGRRGGGSSRERERPVCLSVCLSVRLSLCLKDTKGKTRARQYRLVLDPDQTCYYLELQVTSYSAFYHCSRKGVEQLSPHV